MESQIHRRYQQTSSNSFLDRVEEIRCARNVYSPQLIEGLREEFLSVNYEEKLFEDRPPGTKRVNRYLYCKYDFTLCQSTFKMSDRGVCFYPAYITILSDPTRVSMLHPNFNLRRCL